MLALELCCAAIVAVYVIVRRDAMLALALLAVAGFLGEDSVIRAYGFYYYSPRWHLFLDRVPLMIVLIWPIVILVGMLLRHFVFDDGTATSFIIVATIFLGVFLVGWRAVWTLVESRRHRSAGVA